MGTYLWDIVPFVGGGLLAGALARHIRRRVILLPLSLVSLTVYVALMLYAPFRAWTIEAVVAASALVSLAIAFRLFVSLGIHQRSGTFTPLWLYLWTCTVIVTVFMSWSERCGYVETLAWSGQGIVRAKYRSHGAPCLKVETTGSLSSLEVIEASLWDRILLGDRLKKPAWSVFGELNGQPVRIVPRRWWLPAEPQSR
jgi:hypothetical protein